VTRAIVTTAGNWSQIATSTKNLAGGLILTKKA